MYPGVPLRRFILLLPLLLLLPLAACDFSSGTLSGAGGVAEAIDDDQVIPAVIDSVQVSFVADPDSSYFGTVKSIRTNRGRISGDDFLPGNEYAFVVGTAVLVMDTFDNDTSTLTYHWETTDGDPLTEPANATTFNNEASSSRDRSAHFNIELPPLGV